MSPGGGRSRDRSGRPGRSNNKGDGTRVFHVTFWPPEIVRLLATIRSTAMADGLRNP
jgi:hypothetical protein